MSVISGKSMIINGVAQARAYTISHSAELQRFVSSNTAGSGGRKAGNVDFSGQYTAWGHTPAAYPGQELSFLGLYDAVANKGVSGTAIVDRVEITIDVEGGGIVGHTVNFSAKSGALDLDADAAAAADASTAIPTSAIGTVLSLGTLLETPVFSALADVRTITITLEADNKSYASSSTAGLINRVAGNLDASVAISVYASDFGAVPAVNSASIIKVTFADSLYWLIKFVRFAEASNIEVDRETAALVGCTLNASFSARETITLDLSGTENELGEITDPAGTQVWPEVA